MAINNNNKLRVCTSHTGFIQGSKAAFGKTSQLSILSVEGKWRG